MSKISLKKWAVSFIVIFINSFQPGFALKTPSSLKNQTIDSQSNSSDTEKDDIKNKVTHSLFGPKNHAPTLSNEMVIKLKKMPYDDTTFQLAFQTLIYNSNVEDAYQLALIAVAHRPNDLAWREKLAQVATWVGDYNTGMREWDYVLKHTKKIKTIQHIIFVAKTLGYDQVLINAINKYLTIKPNDATLYFELAKAQNRLYFPNKALETLKKVNSIQPMRKSYELAASIYIDIDQRGNALKTWQKIDKNFGVDTKSVMAEALIYYTDGHYSKALDCLKKGIPTAKKTDAEFWQTLSKIAWIINDKPLMIMGYSHDLKSASSIMALIGIEQIDNPRTAYSYSLKGWNQFHKPIFLTYSLYLAQELNQWQSVNSLLMNLSGKQLKIAEQDESFWSAQANLYAAYGAEDLQRKVLAQGIELHPNMIQLKSSILWLLISNGESRWIKTLMQDWYEQHLMDNPLLWQAYAHGFGILNQFNRAISMYQNHLIDNFADDQVLIDYADLLERVKLYQQALDVRFFVWQRALAELRQSSNIDKKTIKTLSQISHYFVSGTNQVQLFRALLMANDLNSAEINNILLNWMVPRNYFELTSFFKFYYFNNKLPDWAEINLALIKNDLYSLQNIMAHTERELPRSDRINAAERLENTPLVIDLAFAELSERPDAHDIYSKFTQNALTSANSISMTEEYSQFVNLVGPTTKFESKIRLTNTWKMIPYISLWNTKTNDPSVMTNVPGHDFQSKIKFEQKIHRGKVNYNIGYRQALNDFMPMSIDANYMLASRWTAHVTLGYDQEDFQNAFLRIGGVQDQVNLNFMYNITQRDTLTAEGQGLNYYSQDRHYLANGYNLLGLYQHKFWLSYPDYTVGLFGNLYHFNRNGSFGGDVTTLFPTLSPEQQSIPGLVASTQAEDYSQLIPDSYQEGGFIFSFGDSILEYSHIWRPYLWSSAFYNTITGLSYDVKGGFNGTILGRDSLLVYAERGSASTTAASVNYTFGARYLLYF